MQAIQVRMLSKLLSFILQAAVLVYVSIETAMKFLLIINISPLDSCTYLGLDQGGQSCQVTNNLSSSFT
jgi:hypothetical protein